MKKARLLLPLTVILVPILITFTAITATRAYDVPEPYQPPHPYPEPGWAEFPNPGDTVRYYLNGQTVDDIRSEIMNLHGSDFQNATQQVRSDAQQTLQEQQVVNAAWQQPFPQVKQYALTVVDSIKCKLNEKIAKLEKEAAEMSAYGIPTAGETEAIVYIKSMVLPLIENPANPFDPSTLKGQVNTATTVDQLKTVIENTQKKIDQNEIAWKSASSDVTASRIQRFKHCIQTLVEYGNDIMEMAITQMQNTPDSQFPAKAMSNGINKAFGHNIDYTKADFIDKYKQYITNPDSRFNRDWAEAAALYDEAAATLENCDGTNSCVIPVKETMEEAKYLLGDMFHTFWWAYSWYKYAVELGWNPDENLISTFMSQGLPDIPCQWLQHTGCNNADSNDICSASQTPEWWSSDSCTKPIGAGIITKPRSFPVPTEGSSRPANVKPAGDRRFIR